MNLRVFAALLFALSLVHTSYAADVYRVDPEHTFVSFSYAHQNYSIQTSRFDKVTGAIVLDESSNAGMIDMAIDMKSVSTGSVVFNQRIQEDDFFATEKFPVATFKSQKIDFTKDGIGSVQGTLTIKGISKPVVIDFKNFFCSRSLLTLRYTCGANAVTQVNRSDFDMGMYAPFVGDQVTVSIAIEASKE